MEEVGWGSPQNRYFGNDEDGEATFELRERMYLLMSSMLTIFSDAGMLSQVSTTPPFHAHYFKRRVSTCVYVGGEGGTRRRESTRVEHVASLAGPVPLLVFFWVEDPITECLRFLWLGYKCFFPIRPPLTQTSQPCLVFGCGSGWPPATPF